MKQIFSKLIYAGSLILSTLMAQESNLQDIQTLEADSNPPKKSLREKLLEKELELQVPRETVPVEAINYPIKTPIPKTTQYLPMLQTLLHIEAGTLPNPIGVSIIGSFTQEQYRIKKFMGKMGSNLGGKIRTGLNSLLTDAQKDNLIINGKPVAIPQTIKSEITDAQLFGEPKKIPILHTPYSEAGHLWGGDKNNTPAQNRIDFFNNLETKLNNAFGTETKEWHLSNGTVKTTTSAVGVKADMWIFPFMQIFGGITYLHMEQETDVGSATIPLNGTLNVQKDLLTGGTLSPVVSNLPIEDMIPNLTVEQKKIVKEIRQNLNKDLTEIIFPVGVIKNVLDGYAAIGGTNLAIGYKGFFLSCMIAGGYVQLDDLEHDVKGFVEKPFMYVAPRVGYSLGGVMTAHFGVQYIELFGATQGKDLSAVSYGLVSNYGVEIEKYPVNFLVGTSFTPMRDLGISFEYVFSPDVKGLNAEIAYRF